MPLNLPRDVFSRGSNYAARRWLDARQSDLLPMKYDHVVFNRSHDWPSRRGRTIKTDASYRTSLEITAVVLYSGATLSTRDHPPTIPPDSTHSDERGEFAPAPAA